MDRRGFMAALVGTVGGAATLTNPKSDSNACCRCGRTFNPDKKGGNVLFQDGFPTTGAFLLINNQYVEHRGQRVCLDCLLGLRRG